MFIQCRAFVHYCAVSCNMEFIIISPNHCMCVLACTWLSTYVDTDSTSDYIHNLVLILQVMIIYMQHISNSHLLCICVHV